ncbi:MAG: putative ABC transporter permease subunit, partial [Caldanaerobacter sp.]
VMQLEGLFAASIVLNQPQLMPAMVLFFGQITILIFGFLWVISIFYFSDDIKILLSLPFQPYEILFSKYALILINEYIVLAFLMFPAILIYGIGTGAGIFYYLIALIIYLFAPMVPLSIDAVMALWIMKFTNLRKKKDLFTILISTAALIVALAFQYFVNKTTPDIGKDAAFEFLVKNVDLAKILTKSFPPSLWGAYAICYHNKIEGIVNLFLFIVVSLALLSLMLITAQKVYFKALMAGQEIESRRKAIDIEKNVRAGGILYALVLKEWRLFVRVPVYAMNVFPISIIIPFIVFLSFTTQSQMEFERVLQYISSSANGIWIFTAGILVSLFIAGSTSLSSTAFSREGKLFYISKVLPVSPNLQLEAKLIMGVFVSFLILLPTYITAIYLFKISFGMAITVAILSLPAVVLVNIIGLLIDSGRPFFEWDNPQKAMKGNPNVLFTLILTIVMGAIILLLIFLFKTLKVPEVLSISFIEILIVVLNFKFYSLAGASVKKLYFEKE